MNDFTIDWSQTLLYAAMPWIVIIGRVPWVATIALILLALLATIVIHAIGTRILERLAAPFKLSRRLVRYGNRAGAAMVFFMATQVILRSASSELPLIDLVRHINSLCLIAALTWLALQCVQAIEHTIIEMYPADSPDNLQARRVQTQTRVLGRSLMVLIVVIGVGSAMMTLPFLRQFGTSLLASAGFAGLVVGFAAKPILGNLLAGMQLALTQPIRLEDVVIVQNEWGWIEEITGTYVVIRIWDQRRLIVPLQWFIENPFQNWTRSSSSLLGSAFIWVDYRLPLDPLRDEALRVCRTAPEWDGRLCQVQVVDTSERAMQLRVLVSAPDSSKAWDLRCRMRESLVDFIQRAYPDCLPRLRTDVTAMQDIAERGSAAQPGSPGQP
ncbi:mechanosensitive ion channel family protein [Noviherbaspirillum cavernae]|uniref:Mechanosensitive ion channel family protein n=1 Tax=Noviherbaspirillum cavernae TaxID=2320862 RepID=A0A418WWU2_9BURK|nr:mechanosensitive ion channel domain-containing protein [Noviherbaspirillum cavernae]RJG04708.1 mechanosensitive ion channel family protein [Noviherbaspirillum cavernae]